MVIAVQVQTRGCEIKPDLRAHFDEKLQSLAKLWSRLEDAQILVTYERGKYGVEITLHSAGLVARSVQHHHECRQAFDAAVAKVSSQLHRYKEKLLFKARRQNNRDDVNGVVLHPIKDEEVAGPTLAVVNNGYHHEESEVPADSEGLDIGHEDSVVRVKRFALKPMSTEEATLQMDLVGHNFFVYRDAESDQVSVVYKRSGGGYGLIEPVSD